MPRTLPPPPASDVDGPPPDPADARRRREVEQPLDVRVIETVPHLRLRVRNAVHGTTYEVHLPEYPGHAGALCTCPDFSRRGRGTCKHIEAAWLRLDAEGGPGEPRPRAGSPDAARLWRRIDQHPAPRPAAVTPAALRRRGRPLVDAADRPGD